MAETTIERDARPLVGPSGGRIGPGATTAAVLALTALGAMARLYRIGEQPLWMDEVFTFDAARLVAREGLTSVARLDHVAPLYYWMASLSMRLGGASAAWLRLPSALAGTATVPMMFLLGRRLFGSTAIGLGAAAVASASPFAVWYAQEARMYATLILASAVYVYVCWPAATRRPRAAGWAAMAGATALGLYTHHYLTLLSATFGLYLLARLGLRDRRVWLWAASQVVGALAFMPWMVLTAEHLGNSAGTEKPVPLLWMPYTYFTFVAGFSLGPSVRDLRLDGTPAALREHAATIAMVGLSAAAAGAVGLRRLLARGDRWAGSWCLLWVVGPVALAVAATRVTNISYNARYAASCFPAAALVLGAAAASARRSTAAALGVAGLAAAMGWSLWNWYESPHYAKEDLRAAAGFLGGALEEGDLFVLANDRAIPTLRYYGFSCPAGAIVARDPSSLSEAAGAIRRLGDGAEDATGRRAWLLEYREWEVDPARALRSALDDEAEPVAERRWPGVTLRLYRLGGDGDRG